MICTDRGRPIANLALIASSAMLLWHPLAAQESPPPVDPAARQREVRRAFQDQELITAKRFTHIFNPGEPPKVVWRDTESVRRLGGDPNPRVRWFDSAFNEADVPRTPGRWAAYIEATAPNGMPMRRAITFYARPKDFLLYPPPEPPPMWAHQPGPITEPVWREHEEEFIRTFWDSAGRAFLDSESASILLAGFTEAKPLGRRARPIDSATVLDADYHLALKLKLMGLTDKTRDLKPPRRRQGDPAPTVRGGSATGAGMAADAKAKIDAVCRAWAEDTGEPFVTLVARHGAIVTHEAFGNDKNARPIGRDYRCQVFSITKTVTALLFSQFVDQGLIDLEGQVSTVLPDYPKEDPHVPTFRQCFTHTSGLTGHGDFGAMRNPHLENVILNGIDANEPGAVYQYSGMGFDLAAKAMEMVTGKCAARLYHDHLFQPLGVEDARIDDASAGAHLTAEELAKLAQWILNRGSYGELEFISTNTFARLLPVPVVATKKGYGEDEGIGMHWNRAVKAGAPAHSKNPEDWIFSPRAVGHGSFSGCLFVCDLERDLLVVQSRRASGPRHGEWANKLFQTAAECVIEMPATPNRHAP